MSWPSVALVDGVKTGSGSCWASSKPAGNVDPCIVPDSWYSFHADPVMYPRTMHSRGYISALRTSSARPAHSGRLAASGKSAGSAETRWVEATEAKYSDHQTVIAVNTLPLSGIGSLNTTSNAEIRSVATISRCWSSTTYISLTLPLWSNLSSLTFLLY